MNLIIEYLFFSFSACAAARINSRNKHVYKQTTVNSAGLRELFVFIHLYLNQHKIANYNVQMDMHTCRDIT